MILWIILGVMTILAILLLVQQLRGSSTRKEAAAAYLGTRALTVLQSALDESCFHVFGEANGLTKKRSLGEALREFIPGQSDDTALSETFQYAIPLTTEAYAESSDIRLAKIEYGILSREPIFPPGETSLPEGFVTNENRGILYVQGEVAALLPGAKLEVLRSGTYELEYRTLVVGVPYPFNKYTFFDKADVFSEAGTSSTSAPGAKDRFYHYFNEYGKLKKQHGTLDPFPVLDMDPEAAKEDRTHGDTITKEGPIYSTIGHLGDGQVGYRGFSLPILWGENLFGGSPREEIADQMLLMARQMFRKASATEVADLEKYYHLLEADAWRARATQEFDTFGGFIGEASREGVLKLEGIYFVKEAVTLDHEYQGYGVLVTDHEDGITIRRLRRSEKSEGHLTLVATRGDIQTVGGPPEVHASLVVPHGTVKGFAKSKVYGTVFVSYMSANKEEGPEIQRPLDGDYKPIEKPDEKPTSGYARRIRTFIHPTPFRKRFHTRRKTL